MVSGLFFVPGVGRVAGMNSAALVSFLESQLPAALGWLEKMVGANSFTRNPAGVAEVARLTEECFSPLGFTAERVQAENPEFGEHLFLRRPGRSGRTVWLVTHLDTVFPPEEEAREDFHWRPEPGEGRIYGPGTVDIKGGTMVLWLTLLGLREADAALFDEIEWVVAANAAEEALSPDFGAACRERSREKAEAVLVFEGGRKAGDEFTLVTGRKGKGDFRISVSGRASHAGSQHAEGRNAIVELAHAVQHVSTLTSVEKQRTVNVGNISGGTVVNRVPHAAAAELEMRAFHPGAFDEAKAAILSRSGPGLVVDGAEVSVTQLGETAPWPCTESTQALFGTWSRAATELGWTAVAEQRGGLSDANYLHPIGPTLDGLGPSGGSAHCSERSADGTKVPEYVETGSIVPKAVLNTVAILAWLKRDTAASSSAPGTPELAANVDFMAQLKELWGDKVFSDAEVQAMRNAERDGEV